MCVRFESSVFYHHYLQIWEELMLGKLESSMDTGNFFTTEYCVHKDLLDNNVNGSQGWFPKMILSRVSAQHHVRKLCTTLVLTETHKNILLRLFELSISRCSTVRSAAQESIARALGYFPNAYIVLMPDIIELLECDPSVYQSAQKVCIANWYK